MGRPRTSGHELPKRVTFYHGAYYYHPTGGTRKWLGRSLEAAMREWARLVDRPASFRTMNDLFDRYLLDVTPTKCSAATHRDDRRAMPYLRAFFGTMSPDDIDAPAGYSYLETRGKTARVRANREFAVLRHAMTMAVRWGVVKANPLYRLEKNKETPRSRDVRPEEVLAWYRVASPMLRAYTCLKLLVGLRKADMLHLTVESWTDEGLLSPVRKSNGKRILFERTRALDRAVSRLLDLRGSRNAGPLLRTRRGGPYSESGFDSIWQRYMGRFVEAGGIRFTEHDLRAKAGSDAENAGRAGHRLLANTEAQFRRAYLRGVQRVQPVR